MGGPSETLGVEFDGVWYATRSSRHIWRQQRRQSHHADAENGRNPLDIGLVRACASGCTMGQSAIPHRLAARAYCGSGGRTTL